MILFSKFKYPNPNLKYLNPIQSVEIPKLKIPKSLKYQNTQKSEIADSNPNAQP